MTDDWWLMTNDWWLMTDDYRLAVQQKAARNRLHIEKNRCWVRGENFKLNSNCPCFKSLRLRQGDRLPVTFAIFIFIYHWVTLPSEQNFHFRLECCWKFVDHFHSASEHRPQQAVDTASIFVIQRVVEGGGHQAVAIGQSQNACVGYRSEDFRYSAGEEL